MQENIRNLFSLWNQRLLMEGFSERAAERTRTVSGANISEVHKSGAVGKAIPDDYI